MRTTGEAKRGGGGAGAPRRRARGGDAASRSRRDADATVPVRTVFLRGGASTTLHRHGEPAAWMHVVSGEIAEERWSPDSEGGFVYERRVLRCGQSMAAPADALHRVSALVDAAFVTTSACDCGCADEADPKDVEAVMRLARTGADREWAHRTAVGAPAPQLAR